MKKKMLILCTGLLLCLQVLMAQTPQNTLEVRYTESSYSPKGHSLKKAFHLLANTEESKFFNPITEQIDSMCATPEGKAKYQQLLTIAIQNGSFAMSSPTSLYVFQSIPQHTLTLYDQKGDSFTYQESWDDQQWELTDSTRTILGYECMKATAQYHGRTWEAWFTPEIPLAVGPWKLCGLPGLILEARDSESFYVFEADGIRHTDSPIQPLYQKDKYEKVNRKAQLKEAYLILVNPTAWLQARTGSNDIKIEGTSRPKDFMEEWDYIETDYR